MESRLGDWYENDLVNRLMRNARVFLIAAFFGGAAYVVIRALIWILEGR